MKWNIDKSHPICPQICEQLCVAISNGEFKENEKIFSVRELAVKLGVNPNTVQKSFDILETQNVIYSVHGSGWYVSEKIDVAIEVVSELRKKRTKEYFNEMKILGYDLKETIKYINERYGDLNE